MYWFDSPVRGMSRTTVGVVEEVGLVVVEVEEVPKTEPERRPLPEVGRGDLGAVVVVVVGRAGLGECGAVERGVLVPFGEGFLGGGGMVVEVSVSSSIASRLGGRGKGRGAEVGGEGWGGWDSEVVAVAGGVMRGRFGSGGRESWSWLLRLGCCSENMLYEVRFGSGGSIRLEMEGDALAEEVFKGFVGVVRVGWIGDVG